jgi:hypothetical protein
MAAGHARSLTAAATDIRVTPGELVVDPPTLINLGFEWLIDGDANRNASVDVTYRRQGTTEWKRGMPLLRLQGERIVQQNSWNLVVPNMFAGSILDLEPDSAYEARFELKDPDGVSGRPGDAVKTVTVRTRPEPVPYAGGSIYPFTLLAIAARRRSRPSRASCAPTTTRAVAATPRPRRGRA